MKTPNVTVIMTSAPWDKIVSDVTSFYFQTFVFVLGSGCTSIVGIVTNVINIVVFVRQGLGSEGTSASLLGLAIADLVCSIALLWLNITMAAVLIDPPGISWIPWDIHLLLAGYPQRIFSQITRITTAYVAFERCICVVFPFKVKTFFTSRRTCIVVILIFILSGISFIPVFFAHSLGFKIDPKTNTTRLGLISSPNWKMTVNIVLYINTIPLNMGPVVVVLICTMITTFHINLSKTWRESLVSGKSSRQEASQSTNIETSESLSGKNIDSTTSSKKVKTQHKSPSNSKLQRERKVVRMITLISIVFLICACPNTAYVIMNFFNSDIRVMSKYHNLAMVLCSFTFFMDAINSSINIIIYYTMSSRFKQEFKLLFRKRNKE